MKTRVALLYGGRSPEHEVSILSARSVLDAIDRSRFEVSEYLITKDGKWQPRPILPEPGSNPGIDVVFPVLHGSLGEDGTVQGLLEMAELPYVGSGVLASAAAMDKDVTKRICRDRGLPVVEWIALVAGEQTDVSSVPESFGFPLFVKPARMGSSVGISKVRDRTGLAAALRLASSYDRKLIVERAIAGREIECAVLGNEEPIAATPCEILPSREFYDYDDKYVLNQSGYRLPTELPAARVDEIQKLAVDAYSAVGCEGMARVDFLLEDSSGEAFLSEINTIPGFTAISMYPKMWAHSGIGYSELITRLIELALKRREAGGPLQHAR